jgi:hypothetical protein
MERISAVSMTELAIAQLRASATYNRYSRTIVKPDSREMESDVMKMEQIVREIHRRVYSESYGHRIDLVA